MRYLVYSIYVIIAINKLLKKKKNNKKYNKIKYERAYLITPFQAIPSPVLEVVIYVNKLLDTLSPHMFG